ILLVVGRCCQSAETRSVHPLRNIQSPISATLGYFVIHLRPESLVVRATRANICILVPNPVNGVHVDLTGEFLCESLVEISDLCSFGLVQHKAVTVKIQCPGHCTLPLSGRHVIGATT